MSGNKRDTVVIIAVLVIVTGGYLLFKAPQAGPEPPMEHQHGETTSMEQAMANTTANFPTDYNSLILMGNQTMDQRNYAVAAEAYRRALAIDGTDNDVRTDYGACLHGMGLPNRAIDEFRKVLANNPRHVVAVFNMGIVHYGMNQPDSARKYWNEVLTLEPEGNVAATVREYLKQLGN